MVLLEVLLLSVAGLSNLFRVLVGDVSSAWPAPDFLCFFSLRGFLGQVFSGHPGTLTCISFAEVFHFLGIIKVGYGVAPRPYPIFSMIFCLCYFLFFY